MVLVFGDDQTYGATVSMTIRDNSGMRPCSGKMLTARVAIPREFFGGLKFFSCLAVSLFS